MGSCCVSHKSQSVSIKGFYKFSVAENEHFCEIGTTRYGDINLYVRILLIVLNAASMAEIRVSRAINLASFSMENPEQLKTFIPKALRTFYFMVISANGVDKRVLPALYEAAEHPRHGCI